MADPQNIPDNQDAECLRRPIVDSLLREYSLGAGDGLTVPVASEDELPVDAVFRLPIPLFRAQSFPEMAPPPPNKGGNIDKPHVSGPLELAPLKTVTEVSSLISMDQLSHITDNSVSSGSETSLGPSDKKRRIVLESESDEENGEEDSTKTMPLNIPTTPFRARSTRTTELHAAIDSLDSRALEMALERVGGGKGTMLLLEAADEHGFTALMKASAINSKQGDEMVSALIELSADVEKCDMEGFTALHWACGCGSSVTVKHLLDADAGIDIKNMKNGDTPLHRAARFGRLDNVKVLLERRANPNVLNHDLLLPLDVINKSLSDHTGLHAQIRSLIIAADPSRRTMVLHHPDCMEHETAAGHQESSRRIPAILSQLGCLDVMISSDGIELASLKSLEKVHSTEYVKCVVDLSHKVSKGQTIAFTPRVQDSLRGGSGGGGDINRESDTTFSKGSLNAALRACGAAMRAVDLALHPLPSSLSLSSSMSAESRAAQQNHETHRTSFCVVRPPGHHSGVKGLLHDAPSCGFCIFNTACVAALHALTKGNLSRVAIVDFDVHHGNGSEDIVKALKRPDALFFASTHLYDGDFYPGSGKGESGFDLASNVMNMAIPPLWKKSGVRSMDEQAGRLALRKAISHRLCSALRAFNPQLIILSAGFDGAKHDVGNKRFGNRTGTIGLDLKAEDYHFITNKIRQVAEICCEGRVVSVLEGGYGRMGPVTPPNKTNSSTSVPDGAPCCYEPLELCDFTANVVAHIRALGHLPMEVQPVQPAQSPSDNGPRVSTRQRTSRTVSPAVPTP